jgi:signal transduction histidine kinase
MVNHSSPVKHPKQRTEFAYSVLVIVVTPALVLLSLVVGATQLKSAVAQQLQTKALATADVTAFSVRPNLGLDAVLKQQLSDIKQANADIAEISVLTSTENGDFVVSASTTPERNAAKSGDNRYVEATKQNTETVFERTGANGQHEWVAVTPVLQEGLALAVVELSMSSQSAEQDLGKNLMVLSIVGGLAALVSVVLLLHHLQLVEYSNLFKKTDELENLRDEFLDVTAHELHTPTTRIEHAIEGLLSGQAGKVDDKAKQQLANIAAETRRLTRMSADIQAATRLDREQITYNHEQVDCRLIIEQQVETFMPLADDKKIVLSYHKPTEPEVISVDSKLFGVMIAHLLDNAVKYTERGTVTVAHDSNKDMVVVSIKDSGIGLSAAEQAQLFTRFFRAKNAKTAEISGTGLGLWIADRYAQAMGGELTAQSQEGVGSDFRVEFLRSDIVDDKA